jgi:hypothetical protein
MEEIIKSVFESMSRINLAQKKFISGLLITLASFQGKATFRNMSRYSNYAEKTFSRWYRKSFDFLEFNYQTIKQHIWKLEGEMIGVIDASFVDKSGDCTEGLGFFYCGSESKAKKGLEISAISVVDMESHTGYTLDARQTIDVAQASTDKKESRVKQYAAQVRAVSGKLKNLGHLVHDAYYSKKNLLMKWMKPVFIQ